jgi:hypothetical protein
MNDTSLGLRKDLAPRRVPIVVRDLSLLKILSQQKLE